MKLEIDLDKDNEEDLKTIAQMIQRKFPFKREYIINQDYTKDERIMLAILEYLIQKIGNVVPIDDIYEEGKSVKLTETQIDVAIEHQKKRGNIFEPRTGFIQKI